MYQKRARQTEKNRNFSPETTWRANIISYNVQEMAASDDIC